MSKIKRNNSITLTKLRNNKVIKSNELIQKRTHMLSIKEQKIILYLISQIKPEQEMFSPMTFDIIDFCEACGIDTESGKNYKDLKNTILGLSNHGFWIIGKNEDTTAHWIERATIKKNSGLIEIKLDDFLKPFLLQLKERYTQYDLIYTLGMRSKYSIQLYELLKSYQNKNEPIDFSLEKFKDLVSANYFEWFDVKRRVIEPAIKEINELTDIFVTYQINKKGRCVAGIIFDIRQKRNFIEQVETMRVIDKRLNH